MAGDQYRPDKEGNGELKHVVFENNLYLGSYSWPGDAPVQDQFPIIGDPGFSSTIKYAAEGYIPANTALIKDAGMEILPIPSDTIGLRTGLEVDVDILGNPVTGPPDLGAIEVSQDHF